MLATVFISALQIVTNSFFVYNYYFFHIILVIILLFLMPPIMIIVVVNESNCHDSCNDYAYNLPTYLSASDEMKYDFFILANRHYLS